MTDYLLHYVISLSMVTASGIIIGAFALIRRKNSPGALTFASYCFAIAWWAFWHIFMIVPTNLTRAHIAGKISQIGVALIATLFFHFCVQFLESKRPLDRALVRAGYIFSFVILALIPTPYFTADTVAKFGGKLYFLTAGPVDSIYISYFFCIVIYALFRLAQSYRESTGYRREQIKWVILGTIAGHAGGGANYFLSYGIDPYPLVPFGNYGVVVNFICFAYAIFRYRLLDVDDVVEKIRATRLATLGTLSGSISHEIKNPLYVIKGRAESLLSKWNEAVSCDGLSNEIVAAVSQTLKTILSQTERIYTIIKDVLDFAKPLTNPSFEEVNLAEAMEGALSFIGHRLELERIRLIKEITPNLPPIKANFRQVEEIILNLVLNACQAMKDGGVLIITAASGQLKVSDTGPGISPELKHRLFEPFSTSSDEGTGLGLYITKQLVDRNGGKIWFETSSKGTSFFVEFKK